MYNKLVGITKHSGSAMLIFQSPGYVSIEGNFCTRDKNMN